MLEVYDLLCNGLRDACGVFGHIRLSWRLGSDHVGATQESYRIVVVSLTSGDVLWDTGTVFSDDNAVKYGGPSQCAGEVCSWFVTVTDEFGNNTQSVPAAFVWGRQGEIATSDLGPQRRGCVWCSDESINRRWEERDACDLEDPVWQDILGVSADGLDTRYVKVEPRFLPSMSFAQGSLLLSRGLMIVRWDYCDSGASLEVCLPPGVKGELVLEGKRRMVPSGRHTVKMTLQ